MTPSELSYVARLCADRAGLAVDLERPYLAESRLAAVARREGFGSVSDLVRAVRDRGEERMVWAVVESLAPAQSAFFRHPDVLRQVTDDLQAMRHAGVWPRVWIVGCAAGQEAYSLAMLLTERKAEGIDLFASDLNGRLLEQARRGRYSAFEVQRGLSARRLVTFFENGEDDFVISADLRRQVRWARVNLMDATASVGPFDLILCRNVFTGLTEPARGRAAAGLAAALRPGGRIVLGDGETPPIGSGLVASPDRACAFTPAVSQRAAA